LTLQDELIRQGRITPIIFISGESQPSEIIEALKKGAVDFLLKPFGLQSLVNAIDVALEKDKSGLSQRIKVKNAQERFSNLTEKEREICYWMIKGYGNKEIANLNGSAASTVKLHRSRVLEKMGCISLSELLELVMDGEQRMLNIFKPAQE
jgi:FixJ family two-component response regulator